MLIKNFALFLLISVLSLPVKAQGWLEQIRNTEAQLQYLQRKTFYSKTEAERFEGNRDFIKEWDKIVPLEGILSYSFYLTDVSILKAPDNSFMLITWNIPKDDGTHSYFGYILCKREIKTRKGLFRHTISRQYDSFKLLDRSATVRSPEYHTGGSDRWFGMLYTQLIPCDGYYLVLGWDGNNKLTQRKFVDVLWFRGNGIPMFGKDVFRIPKKNPRRIMFEYSSEVTMSLKYDEKNRRIVYSHLNAHKDDPMLEGQYQFYGPDGSYDALVLHKDKWQVEEDVDARNDKSEKDQQWNNPRNPSKVKHRKIMPQKPK